MRAGPLLSAVAFAALVQLVASAAPATAQPDPATIAGALRSVVSVLPQWAGRPPSLEEPEGSGVVVGDGTLILTANHVLGDPRAVLVKTPAGEVLSAKVVGRDGATDLALISVEQKLPAIGFAAPVLPGEGVCAIGNAFGLGPSVVCGTVSAVDRSGVGFNRIEDFVQSDAAVNPGMSGGALIAADGSLAGIVSAIFTKQSDANIGVNFSVSAALARKALEKLEASASVTWPELGARLVPYPPQGEAGPVGAEVMAVAPGSMAEAAALMPGDIVVAAGGRPVGNAAGVTAALALTGEGQTLRLTVLRDGTRIALSVAVAE
jgi:S1-C subfamily serine protease